MNGRSGRGAVALAVAALCAGCGGKIESFSADQVHTDARRGISQTARLYVAPDRVRIEQAGPRGRGRMVMIYRRDQKLLRILMPDAKRYLEKSLDEKELDAALRKPSPDLQSVDAGTDTVQGYKCRKRHVEATVSFMGRASKVTSTVWQSDRLELPLRTETKDGVVTELQNIQPGRQPRELFEVPEGYAKVGRLLDAARD